MHAHCTCECVKVFEEPALRKAKKSAEKAGNFKRRERMFVTLSMVQAMLDLTAGLPAGHMDRKYALLFLLSYTFLLRTPSEALPAVTGVNMLVCRSNSLLSVDGDSLVIVLRRRKNKEQGSRLVTTCTCRKSANSCAYHLIGKMVEETPAGKRVFEGLSAAGGHVYSWQTISIVSMLVFVRGSVYVEDTS